MKSKLGYLCSSESWGGLEMNQLRNALWMKERGHEVVVLCLLNTPIEKSAQEQGLEIQIIRKHRKYYDFKCAKELSQLLIREKITHLIVRSTFDVSIASNVKRILKSNIHTSYFMEMQLGVKKTNLLHTFRYRFIDVWSCPLPWLKVQVENWTRFKNKLVVIPSGVDLSQFSGLNSKEIDRKSLKMDKNALIFGLIGRFDPQKGQLLLLQAMQKSKNKEFHVCFLGEPTKNEGDEYFNEMQQFIQAHQLEERVHIRPFQKDTSPFYNAIDWLVMATKAETFGMVTVESLACGTPVLGSNAGGTPEILKHGQGGVLFKSMNVDDLASKLDEISNQQQEFSPSELIKIAQEYDHQSVCAQVEQALGLTSQT